MPKFKLKKRSNMINILQRLGIIDAFTDNADFTGITNEKISVGQFIHEAFIEVFCLKIHLFVIIII